MQTTQETCYLPIVDPADPRSVPERLARSGLVIALQPRRNGRLRSSSWIRDLAGRALTTGHFCFSDHALRRLESSDRLGLRLAREARVERCVTMDVPLYEFMAPAQRERAWAQHEHRLHASLDAFPKAGIEPIPLIKGARADEWQDQFERLREVGIDRFAFYARELLLEGRADLLQKLTRMAYRRRLHPLLLGVFTSRALSWGPATLAAQHHYVLARRGEILLPRGERMPLLRPEYSSFLRRWVSRRDVAGLSTHNYWRARNLLTPGPVLADFNIAS